MENINVQELKRKLELGEKLLLIDVRTPAEFEQLHVSSAINLPLGSISKENLEKIAPAGSPVSFICKSGGRSAQASQKVAGMGVWKVINITGGTEAAKEAGLKMVEGSRKVISIERQVRIIAGALVLVGVVLGFIVSPGFFYLSGFIGAGLLFAGLTDFCGMALLLERCPWNQCKKENGANK